MENHSEQQPQTEPPQSEGKKLLKLIEDVFSKTYKASHAIYKFVVDEFPALRNSLALVIVLVVVVGAAVWWVTNWAKNRTIRTLHTELQNTNVYYLGVLQSTNSFYSGMIQQAKTDNDKLQKANQDATTKYNEQLREKDSEILKISGEAESLKTRITILEAIPDRVIETATNAITMVQNGSNAFSDE